MIVANYEDVYYPVLKQWWEERNCTPPPSRILPRYGLVIETDEGNPICAGFLHVSVEGFSQICHVVSDKNVNYEERSQALDGLIDMLASFAQAQGCKHICGATTLPQLIARYERKGFKIEEAGITVLGKEL